MTDDAERRIRERAYHMWEAAGRPHGRDDEFWHQAAAAERDAGAGKPEPTRAAGKPDPTVPKPAKAGTPAAAKAAPKVAPKADARAAPKVAASKSAAREAAPPAAATRKGKKKSG